MLAKKTSKNQITLPKKIIEHFPDIDYFDVSEEQGKIILLPLQYNQTDKVREKLAQMGIVAEDIVDAVEWSRRK